METVIVTRHPALVEYLDEQGIAPTRTPTGTLVLAHVADPAAIRGKHVIGVLPLHLAAQAAQVTEVPLRLDAADRGRELSLDELRDRAGTPVTYRVRIVEPAEFADPVSAACALFGEDPTEYIEPDAEFAG